MREFLATTALLTVIAAAPAWGQAQPAGEVVAQSPAASDSARSDGARSEGDVVVTARRREETIRDVPGTINAVTTEQLEARGPVTSAGDLLSTIPGVRFNGVASENLSEVSIRGSGTQRATGADSGVGLFVNGAYIGTSTLGGRNFKTLDYFDIDRVEVLEGPQGALYGRNSEFGTINVVLAKPRFESSGYLRGQYTFDLNQGRLAGVVNEALSDTTAVRIGAEVYGQTKGFYYDPNSDDYYDSTDGFVARAQIRHRSGPLDVTVMVDGQNLDLPSFVNSYNVLPGTVAALPLGFVQDQFNIGHEGQDGLTQTQLRSMALVSYDFGFAKLESTTMGTRWRSQQQFAGAFDVATVTALRQQGQLGAYPFGQTATDVRDRTLYQDLHLTGNSGESPFQWTIGAEALRQNDFYTRIAATSPCAFTVAASICGGTPTAPVCIRPLPTSPNCPTPFPLIFGTDTRTRQKINSLSGYASLGYSTGNFDFTAEGRVTRDRKRVTETAYRLYTTSLNRPVTTNRFNKTQPVWTLTAAYKAPGTTNTLVYGKVGTGYRAGGVNIGTFNAGAPNPFQTTYDNEDTISYEIGVKSNVTRTIFVRLSGYISRTHDAITSINDGCTVTNACGTAGQVFNTNGGTIHAKGLEAALDGRFPVGAGLLSLNLNAATQKAEFASIPSGASGLPLLNSDVAQIPDLTMSAVIDFRHPITDKVTGFFNVNYSGQRGGVQDTITLATPEVTLDDFDLFGARAGVNIGKIQFAAFVKNLGNETIQLLKFQQGTFPLAARYNQPRTFGLNASYRW